MVRFLSFLMLLVSTALPNTVFAAEEIDPKPYLNTIEELFFLDEDSNTYSETYSRLAKALKVNTFGEKKSGRVSIIVVYDGTNTGIDGSIWEFDADDVRHLEGVVIENPISLTITYIDHRALVNRTNSFNMRNMMNVMPVLEVEVEQASDHINDIVDRIKNIQKGIDTNE